MKKEKSSKPLSYTLEEPGEEDLSTDEDEEVELPPEEGEDVNAIVGDKIKLMAELEQMPDNTPIKFTLYPDGKELGDAFASVVANSLGDEVSSEWTVEYHEDATVTKIHAYGLPCGSGTPAPASVTTTDGTVARGDEPARTTLRRES